MPKRQYVATTEDEDELQVSQVSYKRARTEDSNDGDVPNAQVRSKLSGRDKSGKGKAKAVESDEEQDYGEEDIDVIPRVEEEISDDEYERLYDEKVKASLENKRRNQVPGGIAEHGIIEYIEMHQFMCHKYLKFTFGPQINFIIGHNGSGKSAVLSAITVALGGKSISTGRGSGLKSFIREGQNAAEVTIHIKNQGEEAYKPDEYGKTIVITRSFNKEGSSSWKIRSNNGKVISTKRDELATICDHMNIQVDNPMNVLTQDSARKFLSASAPQEKYKLFMRGTLLLQLDEEYELCMDNIRQVNRLLMVKKAALPDLRARKREAQARYDEATKAREQKKKADDLKKELAWSYVSAKETELESKMEEAAKLARRLPRIEGNVKAAKSEFNAANEHVAAFEKELDELESVEDLSKKKTDLQEQMRNNKTELQRLNGEISLINQSLAAFNVQIANLEEEMQKEARGMTTNTQEKHEEAQRKLEEARLAVAQLESSLNELILQRKDKDLAAYDIRKQGEGVEMTLGGLKKEITECDTLIGMAKQKEKDALIPYGKDIKGALEKIKTTRWYGDVPLGPLGVYVAAKDPEVWGELLRNQLRHLLVAFAITDARDRPQLKQILQSLGNQRVTILVHHKDLFDYRSGEPPENCLTVLRALEIADPLVTRILINHLHIESRILTHKRQEAATILKTIGGGSAWSLDKMSIQIFPDGGSHNDRLNFRPLSGPMNFLLTGRDTTSEIKQFSNRKQQAEQQFRGVSQQIAEFKVKYMSLKKEIDSMNEREHGLNAQLRDAKAKFNALQLEANEELPAGLAGIQEAKEEAEKKKESHMEQFKELAKKKSVVDEAQKNLQDRLNEIRGLMNRFQEKRSVIVKKLEDTTESRVTAQSKQRHYEAKYTEGKGQVDKAEEQVQVLQEEFISWREKALRYCEKVSSPRKTEDVQRQLDSTQKALKERERTHGAPVEELALELNKATQNLEKVRRELRQLFILNKALEDSVNTRRRRWGDFRRLIALRCKNIFQYLLSGRGYFGKVLFKHKEEKLILRVQTDDQMTQRAHDKPDKDLTNTLSGGEKSFSTICLLLSLWECIGCPLRCLDEFDVFMDAINRRISMKMMIDTANSSNKQYVLITPQDMTNVAIGSSVRVLRMLDPERGNGMLPFESSSA